jgi:hypothetical protein
MKLLAQTGDREVDHLLPDALLHRREFPPKHLIRTRRPEHGVDHGTDEVALDCDDDAAVQWLQLDNGGQHQVRQRRDRGIVADHAVDAAEDLHRAAHPLRERVGDLAHDRIRQSFHQDRPELGGARRIQQIHLARFERVSYESHVVRLPPWRTRRHNATRL